MWATELGLGPTPTPFVTPVKRGNQYNDTTFPKVTSDLSLSYIA